MENHTLCYTPDSINSSIRKSSYNPEQIQEFMGTYSPPTLDLNNANEGTFLEALKLASNKMKKEEELKEIQGPCNEILQKSTEILSQTLDKFTKDISNMSSEIISTVVVDIRNGNSRDLVDSISNVLSTYNKSHATNLVRTLKDFSPIFIKINQILSLKDDN